MRLSPSSWKPTGFHRSESDITRWPAAVYLQFRRSLLAFWKLSLQGRGGKFRRPFVLKMNSIKKQLRGRRASTLTDGKATGSRGKKTCWTNLVRFVQSLIIIYLGSAALNPISPYLVARKDLGRERERCGFSTDSSSGVVGCWLMRMSRSRSSINSTSAATEGASSK